VKLLFTDIGLPGELSGLELADEAIARQPQMKVVFATGYGTKTVHQAQSEAGPDILQKPFTFSRLAAKIRQVLDHA
jgi:DNA-binding NtrC family response regulator